MTVIDFNTACYLGAAACTGAAIGILLGKAMMRREVNNYRDGSRIANDSADHWCGLAMDRSVQIFSLLERGADLVRAIHDLRARKKGIGPTVDKVVQNWTTTRLEIETGDAAE